MGKYKGTGSPRPFLERQRVSLAITMVSHVTWVTFIFKRNKQKLLRNQTTFHATLYPQFGRTDINTLLDVFAEWWEGINEKELFQRLNETPVGQRPLIQHVSGEHKIYLNFNVEYKNAIEFITGLPE